MFLPSYISNDFVLRDACLSCNAGYLDSIISMSWGVTVYPRTLISPSNGTDVEVYLTTSLFTCCKSNNFQEIIGVHVNTGARNPAAIAFTLVSESAEVSGGCMGAEFQL